MRIAGLLVLSAAVVAAAAEPRFFVAGDGTLDIASKPLGEHVTVRYRRDDGTYDYEAMERIRHILRCRGDGYESEITPRFVELLGYMNVRSGRPLALLSGSRSPVYNDGVRRRGLPAARDSLHTEGLAADLAFPREQLEPLWLGIRDLNCCGAGYYAREGFLHVDVGRPRFWEPSTSRVDENLSAGNARVFARTDYDRYVRGEMLLVRLYAVTLPPIGLERTARLVAEGDGRGSTVTVEQVGAPFTSSRVVRSAAGGSCSPPAHRVPSARPRPSRRIPCRCAERVQDSSGVSQMTGSAGGFQPASRSSSASTSASASNIAARSGSMKPLATASSISWCRPRQ